MKSLTEILDEFKESPGHDGLQEDSFKGTDDLREYLSQQEDYSVSEDDLRHLLSLKREIRDNPSPDSTESSKLFFSAVFDYAMKGIDRDEREDFSRELVRVYDETVSAEQQENILESLAENGIPDMKGAKERLDELKKRVKDYVMSPDMGEREMAHYVNNALTPLYADIEYIEKLGRENESSKQDTCYVMFVDDEPVMLMMYERMFGRYNVVTAESGEQALDILNNPSYNDSVGVIVSDHDMPGMKGIEFLARTTEINKDSYRIMVSGSNRINHKSLMEKGIVDEFFEKPFDPDALCSAVDEGIKTYNNSIKEYEKE
ncbi:MAG: response regulator [Candidatus Woesearchaeota archaeon]